MPWLNQVGAVVEAWYPGQTSGTALAQVLFGDVNPSGKLPVTFPASDAQMTGPPARSSIPGDGDDVYYSEGLLVGYRWYDATGTAAAVPVRVRPVLHLVPVQPPVTCGAPRNQLPRSPHRHQHRHARRRRGGPALRRIPASAGEPPHQLKGFTRVTLQPGQTRTVTFTLNADSVAIWDNAANGWTVQPGKYRVLVGNSSRDLPLHGSLTVR